MHTFPSQKMYLFVKSAKQIYILSVEEIFFREICLFFFLDTTVIFVPIQNECFIDFRPWLYLWDFTQVSVEVLWSQCGGLRPSPNYQLIQKICNESPVWRIRADSYVSWPGTTPTCQSNIHFITDPLLVANLICASVKLHCVECSVPYPLIEQSFRSFESKIIKFNFLILVFFIFLFISNLKQSQFGCLSVKHRC